MTIFPTADLKTFVEISKKERWFLSSSARNFLRLLKYKMLVLFSRRFKKICVVSLIEHMGDIVACEPVTRYIKKKHPDYFLVWYTQYKYVPILQFNENINAIIPVTSLSEWVYLKKILKTFKSDIVFDMNFHNKICETHFLKNNNPNNSGITFENYYDHGNLLQVFSQIAGLHNVPDVTPVFYFPDSAPNIDFSYLKNYIVLHGDSNGQLRNWDINEWNKLCNKILNTYPEFNIVEIGFNQMISSKNERYTSLCGKLDIFQNAALIKGARLFIGIDSSFAHFANALNTVSVILLGEFACFKKYMPYSGRFKAEENATIFNYPGQLKDLTSETVEKLIRQALPVQEVQFLNNVI